jgi:hypothetical protein
MTVSVKTEKPVLEQLVSRLTQGLWDQGTSAVPKGNALIYLARELPGVAAPSYTFCTTRRSGDMNDAYPSDAVTSDVYHDVAEKARAESWDIIDAKKIGAPFPLIEQWYAEQKKSVPPLANTQEHVEFYVKNSVSSLAQAYSAHWKAKRDAFLADTVPARATTVSSALDQHRFTVLSNSGYQSANVPKPPTQRRDIYTQRPSLLEMLIEAFKKFF